MATICVCGVQVPFMRGGAEILVESLGRELRKRGHQVEVVNLPFKWYPKEEIIEHALAWRLLDLTESGGRKIDLVIATKYPSYLVRHPHKVTWLIHQFRQAYDLHGTPYGEFAPTPQDERVRQMVIHMDNSLLPESRRIFTISKNVGARLLKYNGIASQALYPPLGLEGLYHCQDYGDFILSVGRLEAIKRVDLLIRAMGHLPKDMGCIIVGDGPDRSRLEGIARELGLGGRVKFLGYVDDQALLELYANAFAVFYAPFDEDYGYVTVEAFKSQKPVVTAQDSGGVLEFVEDGRTGLVAAPEPQEIADKIERLYRDRELCRRLGQEGSLRVQDISWDNAIKSLLMSF